MPRKARVLVPECPHHIVQRGHNRKAIFLNDEDYDFYLDNLLEWKERLGIKLYAWCLMTNHLHLIAEPGKDARVISTLMKRVNGRHSAHMNKLEGRSGALWEGRYKASPIQRERYLLNCLRYVELNPVCALMVAEPEDYRWSSYGERVGKGPRRYLDTCAEFDALGATLAERRSRYAALVREARSDDEQAFIRDAVRRNQLTGMTRFTDEIEQRIGLRVSNRKPGRPSTKNDHALTKEIMRN